VLVLDQRVALEHRFESRVRVVGLVAKTAELGEVAVDLAFMPCREDRVDV
jgi:hypothetical protein